LTAGVADLSSAFDPARLSGGAKPLPVDYATIPDALIYALPQQTGYGCKDVGVNPVDRTLGIPNPMPTDFNPRPKTNPSR